MRQEYPRRVTRLVLVVQGEGLAGLELGRAVLEFADPELGTLQVGKDADRAADLVFDPADLFHQRAHQRVVGVAHIDAEDVGAGLEQRLDHMLFGRGRPQRCENLDLAAASH